MSGRENSSYSIAWASGQFTITWASTYSPVSFSSAGYVTVNRANSNYFDIGPDALSLTTLNYQSCTSPSAGSRSALLTAINNLITTTSSSTGQFDTVTTYSATGDLALTTQAASNAVKTDKDFYIGTSVANAIRYFIWYSIESFHAKVTAATHAANRVYTFADKNVDSNITLDAANNTFTGDNSFSGKITNSNANGIQLTQGSNQAVFGTSGARVTLNYNWTGAPYAASRTVSFPATDPAAASELCLSEGTATWNGAKTMTNLTATFPTSGGTGTALNYYEECPHTTNFQNSGNASNSVSNIAVKLTRIGRMVTMYLPQTQVTLTVSTGTIDMVTAIPSRFRPANDMNLSYRGINAGSNGSVPYHLFIVASTGASSLKTNDGGSFSLGVGGSQQAHGFSWSV